MKSFIAAVVALLVIGNCGAIDANCLNGASCPTSVDAAVGGSLNLLQTSVTIEKAGEQDIEEAEGHAARQLLTQRLDQDMDVEDSLKIHRRRRRIKVKGMPDLPGEDLIQLGRDVGKLMEKFSGFVDSVPSQFQLENLVKSAAGGVSSINTKFVKPALDGLEAGIQEASSKLPEFALPLLGCTVQLRQSSSGTQNSQSPPNSLVAVSSAEDASWIADTLAKIKKLLDEISEKPGMEVLKAGKSEVVDPAFNIIKTEVIPFVEKMLAFVREKIADVLNIFVGLVLPDPPSLLETDKEQESTAQVFTWLKEEIPTAVTAVTSSLVSEAMADTWKKLNNLTKCRGGPKPSALINPQKLEYLWPTIMTRTIFTIQQSLIDMVLDEMQPHILKFISGMASVSDSMGDAVSTAVSEVPAVGPLIGVVLNFVVQNFNKILWIPFAPALIDCSLRLLMTETTDAMSGAVEKIAQRVADNSGASSAMSTSDLPRGVRGTPIANVLKWIYNMALPDIITQIQEADEQRATIALAAQGFQCSS